MKPRGCHVWPAELSLRRRYCGRLLQAEFQQRLAGYLHLLAAREDLDARAGCGTNTRANRRALAAAGNRADDGARYRATANFFAVSEPRPFPFRL